MVDLIRGSGGEAVADTSDISVPEGAKSPLSCALDEFGKAGIGCDVAMGTTMTAGSPGKRGAEVHCVRAQMSGK
ncbi:hypothetical protein GCM10010357_15480 [Streptomyces luteireticuli]|uniref:Uncharacterized protein n=1 Tax=Streptomyces luteireticuli TaxID=173858 RepID=A0ABN0YH54_9ACTN